MKVAINTIDYNWAGGGDFLSLIIKALNTQKDVEVLVLCKKSKSIKYLPVTVLSKYWIKSFLRLVTFKKRQVDKNLTNQFCIEKYLREIHSNELNYIFYNPEFSTEYLLEAYNIDVVLPVLVSENYKQTKTQALGYIFDFVYKEYWELYSSEFCYYMDIQYAKTLKTFNKIIVNSEKTRNDILKYYPYSRNKILTLPFTPNIDEKIVKEAIAENESILGKYNISSSYFIISNQLWLHKAHEIAFKALQIVKEKYGESIKIICTGLTTDLSGGENRLNFLRKYIDELGLTNEIIFTGHISKKDQIVLMLNSICVLQPTTFEGGPGGGSVYQALALGKSCIISDIEVNKEIEEEELVTFFKLNDSIDLANKMIEKINNNCSEIGIEAALNISKAKLTSLGQRLIEYITEND